MDASAVLTTGQVARYCGVHFRTVLRWIEAGKLKAYALPGRGDHRVRVESFLAFLAEHHIPVPDDFAPHPNRVLVVDDDIRMARSMGRVLTRAGYEVELAEDGFEAGKFLHTFRPAVMTLDLQMPGVNGHDVLEFLRNTKTIEHSRLKVLVVSGASSAAIAEAIRLGADGWLAKPFENEELLRSIQALFGDSGRPLPVPVPASAQTDSEPLLLPLFSATTAGR